MANLIIENKNVTSEPMYNPIFLKAGLAKIYKILDKFTCAVDDKLMMCFNGDSLIDAADLPLKYSMKCSVSYDLN